MLKLQKSSLQSCVTIPFNASSTMHSWIRFQSCRHSLENLFKNLVYCLTWFSQGLFVEKQAFSSILVLLHNDGSWNECIRKQRCCTMISLHSCSTIKDKSNKNVMCLSCSKIILVFLWRESLWDRIPFWCLRVLGSTVM